MKKQILFTAAVISAIIFFSCSKEKIQTQQQIVSAEPTNTTQRINEGGQIYINPLSYKLEAWFPFNSNVKDSTGHLLAGKQVPLQRTGIRYTYDRTGKTNAALKLDGTYYVYFTEVPQQTNTSVSVWLKRGEQYDMTEVIIPGGQGPGIYQFGNTFRGVVYTSENTPYIKSTDFNDQKWHHLVVTYDGNYDLKLYVDGALQGTWHYTAPINAGLYNYFVGLMSLGNWKGYVDDLRFYSRTLSASDVTALYNL
ncbi:MAG TPA: LamG domain-containing protein [Chitinophagaceae bacterium]|jgi:hypothetical protein|nr:LamG domain-containing protein [Chitinophagaceae bacterium]